MAVGVFDKATFLADIADADMVFVGIGDELQVKLSDLKNDSVFATRFREAMENTDKEWLIPYLIRYYLLNGEYNEILSAFTNLERLLAGKNYFVISLSTDDLLRKSKLNPERVVFPCGTYEKLQCEDCCTKQLYSIDNTLWCDVSDWVSGKKKAEDIHKPICPVCGKNLVVNQFGQPSYNEEGYLSEWNTYTKWLQGTVNRKLCIVELGVGLEFPSIIRWPMEKVCFYNQKSKFYRIHENLYQIPDTMAGRGIAVKQNALTFMNELFH